MRSLKAMLIDDEYQGREVLKTLLKLYCLEVTILAEASHIQEAEKLIRLHKPELIFLDIEMPGGDGFRLLECFPDPEFNVIFVTSFDHYALRAIKFSALDYLLKPVIIPELKAAIDKALKQSYSADDYKKKYSLLASNLQDYPSPKKLCLNNKTKTDYILISEIIYLQADINYTHIYLRNGQKHVTSKSLKEYDELLCGKETGFIRIHKSTIINPDHLIKFSNKENSHILMSTNISLEISRRKKAEVTSLLASIKQPK